MHTVRNKKASTSMVRVHDLSDGFKLVGKFDFDKNSNVRRQIKPHGIGSHEMAHLHKL